MPQGLSVLLTRDLVAEIELRPEAEQDALLAFVEQLRIDGFDLIAGAKAIEVPGLVVEFIEPGEIPEMVWARLFLTLERTSITLVVRQFDDRIVLDKG